MTETAALTTTEHDDFARLEAKVEQGLSSFVEVGQALASIHERKLYRAKYATFDDYCKSRWNLARNRAYQLMQAAEGVEGLEDAAPKILDKPLNESQGRAFSAVSKADRPAVLREAADRSSKNGKGHAKVSAKTIAVVAKRAADTTSSVDRTPAVPWSDFATEVHAVIADIRSASLKLNTTLDADSKSKELRAQYAKFYSHAGTIGALNAVVRNLEDNLPAAASDKPPGYVPARVVEARKSMAEGRV